MASLSRAVSVFRRQRLSIRRLQTAAAAASPRTPLTPSGSPASGSPPPPLLARLLREAESGVKRTLDSEEAGASAPGRTGDGDAMLWERLVLALHKTASRKAHLVLEWKLEKLLEEEVREHKRFSNLIALSAKLGDLSFAMRVFETMESAGIRPNADVFNALVRACLSSGNAVTALSLFEIMSRSDDAKPDLSTYNAIIGLYSKWEDDRGMMDWFSAAKSAGFSPDIETYEALITGFTRAGRFGDAAQCFREMVSSGIIPNMAILECVLDGLFRQKSLGEVKEFWRSLQDGGWEVNERMVEKSLSFYAEVGGAEEMEQLLESLQQKLHFNALLPQVHCGIIRMYAGLDRLDDVEYSVGRMLKNRMHFTSSRDVEAVISCYFRRKAYERLDLFLQRVRGSYKFAKSTYDLLIAGYRRVGLQEKLELVKKDMQNDGFI